MKTVLKVVFVLLGGLITGIIINFYAFINHPCSYSPRGCGMGAFLSFFIVVVIIWVIGFVWILLTRNSDSVPDADVPEYEKQKNKSKNSQK